MSCNEACRVFMISYLSGYGISVLVPNGGWRYMFLLGGLVAIVQLICMLYMPESPVWLRQKVHSMEFDPGRNANHCLVFICAFSSVLYALHGGEK